MPIHLTFVLTHYRKTAFLLSEGWGQNAAKHENEDLVYIVRISSSEYEFGSGEYGHQKRKYVDTLYDMLNTNVAEIGITSMQGTMLDWLRTRNYKGIRYDRNIEWM